jgi:multiple sugar transport system ATP-binding protein
MTARRNMSFALESTDMTNEEIRESVNSTAEMLGIREHLDQKPGELSGGQQQRVALGRSIVRDPKIFLLDEPLSNLDAKLRVQMRAELQQLHRRIESTTIYVTHDQEEAMTMSDRIAILNAGRLQQFSTPGAAYSEPNNRFVAGFIGSPSMNFVPCEYSSRLMTEVFSLEVPETLDRPDEAAEVGVRPENISLSTDGSQTMGTINVFERLGSYNIIYVQPDGYDEEITVQTPADRRYEPEERVGLSVIDDRFHVFAADGETIYSPEADPEKEITSEQV